MIYDIDKDQESGNEWYWKLSALGAWVGLFALFLFGATG